MDCIQITILVLAIVLLGVIFYCSRSWRVEFLAIFALAVPLMFACWPQQDYNYTIIVDGIYYHTDEYTIDNGVIHFGDVSSNAWTIIDND